MKKLIDYINTVPVFYNTPPTPPQLRTSDDPPPAPAAIVNPRYIECDFCHCKVTSKGQVYEMSEIAYGYRDEKDAHRKAVAKLDEEIVSLRAQITAKDAEIAALKGSRTEPAKRSFL